MQNLSLGFSPCPNDTFIFDALVHQKIDSPFSFDLSLEDVETLNAMAFEHCLDVTKISIHALFHLLDKYRLLTSGGAMGKGCGPLVIQKERQELKSGKVALPGKYTTAALLFRMAMPGDFEFIQMPFEKIMPAVLEGTVDAGVIIHESRFTYKEHGLQALVDLGQWWEEKTGCLIPLGGIMVSNRLDTNTQQLLQLKIKESIEYAERHPNSAKDFIFENAQELDEKVVNSHINLYVNNYSKDIKEEGKNAILTLYREACRLDLLPKISLDKENSLFV